MRGSTQVNSEKKGHGRSPPKTGRAKFIPWAEGREGVNRGQPGPKESQAGERGASLSKGRPLVTKRTIMFLFTQGRKAKCAGKSHAGERGKPGGV